MDSVERLRERLIENEASVSCVDPGHSIQEHAKCLAAAAAAVDRVASYVLTQHHHADVEARRRPAQTHALVVQGWTYWAALAEVAGWSSAAADRHGNIGMREFVQRVMAMHPVPPYELALVAVEQLRSALEDITIRSMVGEGFTLLNMYGDMLRHLEATVLHAQESRRYDEAVEHKDTGG